MAEGKIPPGTTFSIADMIAHLKGKMPYVEGEQATVEETPDGPLTTRRKVRVVMREPGGQGEGQ